MPVCSIRSAAHAVAVCSLLLFSSILSKFPDWVCVCAVIVHVVHVTGSFYNLRFTSDRGGGFRGQSVVCGKFRVSYWPQTFPQKNPGASANSRTLAADAVDSGEGRCKISTGSKGLPHASLTENDAWLCGFVASTTRGGGGYTLYYQAVAGPQHWRSVADGSPLHCEWHLRLSSTAPAKPCAPQHF